MYKKDTKQKQNKSMETTVLHTAVMEHMAYQETFKRGIDELSFASLKVWTENKDRNLKKDA